MNYDILFFDADDTLLDFKKSEAISFKIVLQKNGITQNISYLHEKYIEINDSLWTQHALGNVTKDFLKIERFSKLLEQNNLQADPSKMCEDYLDTLPSQVFLIDGALELLQTLHRKIPMIIVTNGIGTVQHKRLLNSGINPYIDLMIVSEECGYSKPDKRIFDYTLNQLQTTNSLKKILMIGDKLETDILGANNTEIDSCWFNPLNLNNTTDISPKFEINSLLEVLKIL
jgi:2-haloacid dehalogenase